MVEAPIGLEKGGKLCHVEASRVFFLASLIDGFVGGDSLGICDLVVVHDSGNEPC